MSLCALSGSPSAMWSRHKLRRLEEEKAVLARKLVRVEGMGRESSSMSLELGTMQEELKEYKAQLKCSVCHDRRKEVSPGRCHRTLSNEAWSPKLRVCRLGES